MAAAKKRTSRNQLDDSPLIISEVFAPIAKALLKYRDVTLSKGWGVGNVVLKRGTKIFAMQIKGRFVVKLSTPRVTEIMRSSFAKRFESSPGRAMKDWLSIDFAEVDGVALAQEAYGFAVPKKK